MINRFEGFLENGFEGLFKKAFPRELAPRDLAKALNKQMLKQRLKSIKYIYVPNYYLIRLHSKDYQSFAPYQNSLIEELTEYLTRKIEERQFYLMGELEIYLDYDNQIAPGEVDVFGKLQENIQKNTPKDSEADLEEINMNSTLIYKLEENENELNKFNNPQPLALKIKRGIDQGRIFKLKPGLNLIGRQKDGEVNLVDTSVSRYHAHLEISPKQILLSDLGSTNGTIYQDEIIENTILNCGDEFQVGNTVLFLTEEGND